MNPGTEQEGRGAFRKLFMKLGEKVGTVKVSELSVEYLTAVKEADTYKEMLCELVLSAIRVFQENPKFVPELDSKMGFESQPGLDIYEQLETSLKSMKDHFALHEDSLKVCIDVSAKLALEHRTLQKRARRAIHFMRTFINVDYNVLNEERQILMVRRQEMDFAKHDYVNDQTCTKKANYEKALSQFNMQSDKVFKMLATLPEKKEKHRNETIKLLDEMRKFHEKAAEQCFRASKARW